MVIVVVLGGARSGKSQLAEALAGRLPGPVTYVATGTATDADMAERIARHRRRRPAVWSTAEVGAGPLDALPATLAATPGTVLVDSLGTWLAGRPDFAVDLEALCAALRRRRGDTVVVSDEVGLGVHPSTEVGRRFRDAVGEANAAVVAVADRALLAVAGRALELRTAADVLAW